LEPSDYIVCHINIEITDNIRAIFDRWRELCDFFVDIYNIDDYRGESDIKNDLAYSELNQFWGVFRIYVSDHYPEAHIIHEMLHAILRIEGYSRFRLDPKVFLLPREEFVAYKNYFDLLNKLSNELTNSIDHIVINELIKKYKLDFQKLYDLQCQHEHKYLEIERVYNNEMEKVINNMKIAFGTLLYDGSLDEKCRHELLEILKEKYSASYEYRCELVKVIDEYPHSNTIEYRILLLKILEEIKKIVGKEIEEYKGMLDLIVVE